MIHQPPDAGERRDMILAPGLDIGGRPDLLEVDRGAHHRQAVRDHQAVVAVEIDQILPVPLGGQVGDVAVPVEQVEGRIVVAEQIIADDIIPDQVTPAQAVEGRGQQRRRGPGRSDRNEGAAPSRPPRSRLIHDSRSSCDVVKSLMQGLVSRHQQEAVEIEQANDRDRTDEGRGERKRGGAFERQHPVR